MQICALDSQARLIFADFAHKHQDYFCMECRQIVRLRRGIHRKAHFYHIQPNRLCRLHAKGMPHLMLQQYLKGILPEGEAELECPFPSIGRVADVAWHPKRLIYEIQCSPISAEEVRARNTSYASLGYQVVWILHDHRYNQYRLSAAEHLLLSKPHYFSDMNADGEGKIYDQFAVVLNGRRVQKLSILAIDPAHPKFFHEHFILCRHFPKILRPRMKSWTLCFSGDMVDCCFIFNKGDPRYRELVLEWRKLKAPEGSFGLGLLGIKKDLLYRWIAVPYLSLMKLILERACR